jgi:DNA-binding response OmpR family regulator
VTRVIVAHEEEALREAALRVVREAGHEGIGVADGVSARALVISPPHPVALVVDVGLPGVLGYELVDEIRRRALPTRVVLVASVFSKTAYKRRPTTLYGADDYVEQHHIPDQLPEKLARLLNGVKQEKTTADVHDPASLSAQQRSEIDHIRRAGEGRLMFRYGSREEAVDRARRLARVILADVVLYNGTAVEEGMRAADPLAELALRLRRDLDEGRELLALRVPPEIVHGEDFIGAALAEFVRAKAGGDPLR